MIAELIALHLTELRLQHSTNGGKQVWFLPWKTIVVITVSDLLYRGVVVVGMKRFYYCWYAILSVPEPGAKSFVLVMSLSAVFHACRSIQKGLHFFQRESSPVFGS